MRSNRHDIARFRKACGAALPVALVAGLALPVAAATVDQGLLARGRYLVEIMDCTGCHTYGALAGHPEIERFLAGSETGFRVPGLGTFYPSNLTPDATTGLGRWRRADIARALRSGVIPGGRILAPAMPWRSYAHLTPGDAMAIAAYLKSLPSVHYRPPGPSAANQTPSAPYLTRITPDKAARPPADKMSRRPKP